MSLIQTCKCEECDMQKSFANHWVMLYERNGNLVILPKWDDKMVRRTRHFCGRAHASRYVERWIANPMAAALPDGSGEHELKRVAQPQSLVESVLEEIALALERGEMVKISSFGSFAVRQKGERIGRNPKTGEEVPILPRRVLVFRASHVLREFINKRH